MKYHATQAELAEALGRSTASVSRDIRRDDWPVSRMPPWSDDDVAEIAEWQGLRGHRFHKPRVSYTHVFGWTVDSLAEQYRSKNLPVFDVAVLRLGVYLRNWHLGRVLSNIGRRNGHILMPVAEAYGDDPDGFLTAMPACSPDTWRDLLSKATDEDQIQLMESWNIAHLAMEDVSSGPRAIEGGDQ